MKIAIGSDHAGYKLKQEIIYFLKSKQIEVIDYGTDSLESVDYADYAIKVGGTVQKQEADFGILVCFTGIGMSICANKIKGIRASLVTNVENARLTREHNNANILCLGAKDVTTDLALLIVEEFLNAKFLYGRHERRVNKVMEVENE